MPLVELTIGILATMVVGLLIVAIGSLVLLSTFLLVLTVAAFCAPRAGPPPGPSRRRFAVLVPAHNEDMLIGRLLNNLRQLDYPREYFDLYVVADNCDDTTAELAREHGARVYERFNDAERAKGFALRWLLEQIRSTGETYDAFVVLDADSVVAPNFLRSMDARLEGGSQAIQAYYTVLNSGQSLVAGLRFAALAAVHYLRPLGRSVLGLSCGLKGNGMCFAAPVLDRFAWRWFTLAEDVEFHIALVREGIRVDFAPETWVSADMPITLAQSASQNSRWESGRLQLIRTHVPSLVRDGLRLRSGLRLDAAFEQCVPPLSVPFALGAICVVLSALLQVPALALVAGLTLLTQAGYLLASLKLVGAPGSAYRALCAAPLYILWKLGLYGRTLLSAHGTRVWVRTPRLS